LFRLESLPRYPSHDYNRIHLHTVLVVVAWALVGAVLLVAGVKLIDLITPGKLEDHVFKDQNIAAAVVYGCALIALAIIIASAMH